MFIALNWHCLGVFGPAWIDGDLGHLAVVRIFRVNRYKIAAHRTNGGSGDCCTAALRPLEGRIRAGRVRRCGRNDPEMSFRSLRSAVTRAPSFRSPSPGQFPSQARPRTSQGKERLEAPLDLTSLDRDPRRTGQLTEKSFACSEVGMRRPCSS